LAASRINTRAAGLAPRGTTMFIRAPKNTCSRCPAPPRPLPLHPRIDSVPRSRLTSRRLARQPQKHTSVDGLPTMPGDTRAFKAPAVYAPEAPGYQVVGLSRTGGHQEVSPPDFRSHLHLPSTTAQGDTANWRGCAARSPRPYPGRPARRAAACHGNRTSQAYLRDGHRVAVDLDLDVPCTFICRLVGVGRWRPSVYD
jgi:hypothetical protein